MTEDAWLAERMGRPCFTVEPGDALDALAPGFYQAKVPCADVERASRLEAAGFRVVDVNVTLAREPGDPGEPAGAAEVAEARESDREELLAIAANDYDVSRFHMDPDVPAAVASAIKRDWVAAYLDGERGERLLVSRAGGRATGFLAVLARDDAELIDLVAVRSDARRSGAGRALVARLLRDAGRRVLVGTQAANVGALRFYERLGFETCDTRFVLHRHVT